MLELFCFQHFRTDEGFVLKPKRVLWHITLGIIDHNTHPPRLFWKNISKIDKWLIYYGEVGVCKSFDP